MLYNNNIELTNSGALVAYSGKYTGRVPTWKHFVKNEECINKLVYYINNLDLHFKEFNTADIILSPFFLPFQKI